MEQFKYNLNCLNKASYGFPCQEMIRQGVVWLQKDDSQDDEDDDGDYKQGGVGVVHDLLLSRIISGHIFSHSNTTSTVPLFGLR